MVYNGVNHSRIVTFIEKVGMFDETSNAEQQNNTDFGLSFIKSGFSDRENKVKM